MIKQKPAMKSTHAKSLPPLSGELLLLESGAGSLCVALLIADLDDELTVDLFDSDDMEMPVSSAELTRAAENAAA